MGRNSSSFPVRVFRKRSIRPIIKEYGRKKVQSARNLWGDNVRHASACRQEGEASPRVQRDTKFLTSLESWQTNRQAEAYRTEDVQSTSFSLRLAGDSNLKVELLTLSTHCSHMR